MRRLRLAGDRMQGPLLLYPDAPTEGREAVPKEYVDDQLAAAQPLDAGLTAIAALTTTSFGRGILELAHAAALLEATGHDAGTWTPEISAAAGTFAAVSATGSYFRLGSAVLVDIAVEIGDAGSASGALVVSLPFASASSGILPGREVALTGRAVTGGTSGGNVNIVQYDGGTIIATGRHPIVSGWYRT